MVARNGVSKHLANNGGMAAARNGVARNNSQQRHQRKTSARYQTRQWQSAKKASSKMAYGNRQKPAKMKIIGVALAAGSWRRQLASMAYRKWLAVAAYGRQMALAYRQAWQ
jgi:hypothetical protein